MKRVLSGKGVFYCSFDREDLGLYTRFDGLGSKTQMQVRQERMFFHLGGDGKGGKES